MRQRGFFSCFSALRPRRLAVLALLLGLASQISGCDISGLADIGESLLDPDAALLDRPGRRLVKGSYSSLAIDGSLDQGGNVVAIRNDKATPRIAIVPFPDGQACEVDPGHSFERVSSRIDVELDGLVAVQRNVNDAGRGEISFVDFDCSEALPSLADARLPRVLFPPTDPRGALSLTGAGELHLVDAVNRTVQAIATNVSTAQVKSGRLFTLEDSQLVLRNNDLAIEERLGEEVTSFVTTGGDTIQTAFIDAEGVNIYSEDDGITQVTHDACDLVSLGNDVIAFHSPCDAKRLNVLASGSKVGSSKPVHFVGPDNVVALSETMINWGLGSSKTEFIYVAGASKDATSGRLVLATIPANTSFDDESFQLASVATAVAEKSRIFDGELYLEWDEMVGTLAIFDRNSKDEVVGIVELAQRVAQLPGSLPFSPRGVLANYDGTVGTLLRLERVTSTDNTTTGIDRVILAERVPIQTHQVEAETGEVAFVGDVDETGAGRLYLSSGSEPRMIVDGGVLPGTVRFLEQPRGVAYLSAVETPGIAELHAWLRDSELDLLIKDDVSEYRALPWPSPGILYAVPEGSDAGLWFSKAR